MVPGPAGVPCLPCCLELWAGPCRESSEWLAGPNFTVRPRAHSTRSMGRIPHSSAFPALTIAGTRPAGDYPAIPLGHPHLVGPVGFGWRGACALFLLRRTPPLHLPRAQCAQDPVPARSPAMPCPVLPCLAPCLAMPCHALVSQVQPGRCPPARHCPVTPTQSGPVARGRRLLALALRPACVSLPTITTTTSFGLVTRLLSFPGLTLASPSPLAQFQWEISKGFLLGLDRPLL